MSSVPTSSAKFSLADIKAKMVKKEKTEETPAPNPVHVPATRSKMSAKKRKATDSVIQLDSFEGLSATEVKDKMHSLYSMMHLGFKQMHELLKNQEYELRESKEAYANLKRLSASQYKKLEEAHAEEVKELLAKADEEKKLVVEEAKNSATTSVYEAMYEMAKEAAAAEFSLPQWDLHGWGQILGKDEDVQQTDSKETQVAAGVDGAGDDAATTGNEGKDAQA